MILAKFIELRTHLLIFDYYQVLIEVPESEVARIEPGMSVRLPQEWRYVSHKRVSRSSHSSEFYLMK